MGEAELLAVLWRTPALWRRDPGDRDGLARHVVRAHPTEDLHRQSFQQIGHAGSVVTGVEDDQDVAVARLPAAHADEVFDHAADLSACDLGDIVGRPQPQRVQNLTPRGPARLQRGDERVGPPGHELVRGASAAAIDVTEQAVRTGRCVGASVRSQ